MDLAVEVAEAKEEWEKGELVLKEEEEDHQVGEEVVDQAGSKVEKMLR